MSFRQPHAPYASGRHSVMRCHRENGVLPSTLPHESATSWTGKAC
jgi:hypothetical protein